MNIKAEDKVERAARLRDIEIARAFNRAFEMAEELTKLAGIAASGNRHATVSEDVLRRASMLLSFCAGYAAGVARIKAMNAEDVRRLAE
jgi:hypothetical protein